MPRPDPRQQLAEQAVQLRLAEQAVTEAQSAISAALLNHESTGPARERLAAAEQRRRELEQRMLALQSRLEREQADLTDRRAAELCEQIGASIQAFLDKFPLAVLPEIQK